MIKKITLAMLLLVAVVSCKEDDDIVEVPVAPNEYAFERDDKQTVSYDGQLTRIDMHSQLKSYLSSASGNELEIGKLNSMFNHTEDRNDFTDGSVFDADYLNSSNKNIVGATASSVDYSDAVKISYDNMFSQVELNSNPSNEASNGVAGYMDRAEDDSKRILVDAYGFEYVQVLSKSIMGSMQMDQMINKYLTKEKLDGADNTENKEEKAYTAMEHYWDEAFGYASLSPMALGYTSKNDMSADEKAIYGRFWGEYIFSVDGSEAGKGIKNAIMNAFLTGRQAIVNKNYTLRDAQAKIIMKSMSKVCAIKAVNYLNKGKTNVLAAASTDKASAFHAISEAYGFIYALQFSNDSEGAPYFSKDEVDAMIVKLVNQDNGGLYDVSIETILSDLATKISAKFGFDPTKV
ncbi:MAG: DUF4856 domain-containing protein [Flavobacteriaceae bacterium]|nr:DUF4856 domain-containing protein [Flavobacteriaceae bacterium]